MGDKGHDDGACGGIHPHWRAKGGAGTGDAESGKYLPSVHWDRIKDEQD